MLVTRFVICGPMDSLSDYIMVSYRGFDDKQTKTLLYSRSGGKMPLGVSCNQTFSS